MNTIISLQQVRNKKRTRDRLQKHNKAIIGANQGYIEVEKKVKKHGLVLIVRKSINLRFPDTFSQLNVSENMILVLGLAATDFFEKVGVQVEFI